jgi:hypothetical protein
VLCGRVLAADEETPALKDCPETLFFAALTCRGFRDTIFALCPLENLEVFGHAARFFTTLARVCVSLSRLHSLTGFGVNKPDWILKLLGCDALRIGARVLAKYCHVDVFVKMPQLIKRYLFARHPGWMIISAAILARILKPLSRETNSRLSTTLD